MFAQVFFWDTRAGKLPVSRVAARDASGQLTSLQAVPDGRVIYAGTRAGEVCVGTSPRGSCQRKMCVPESPYGVHARTTVCWFLAQTAASAQDHTEVQAKKAVSCTSQLKSYSLRQGCRWSVAADTEMAHAFSAQWLLCSISDTLRY